jgi:hypothetical protein
VCDLFRLVRRAIKNVWAVLEVDVVEFGNVVLWVEIISRVEGDSNGDFA